MDEIPVSEELDFQYLLELLPVLHDMPEFACLPELFSIIGHERLINLCKYAGGETIKIPTIDQLSDSIEALKLFYRVFIRKSQQEDSIPVHHKPTVMKIKDVFCAG